MQKLHKYSNKNFDRGAPKYTEIIWQLIQTIFISSPLPGSLHRIMILRLFGATIGHGVTIKPSVRVKFPWRLEIGNDSWIGERVWIDNLDFVKIGNNVCVSQDAYICTGSHNWATETFDLLTKPVIIEDGAWICARTSIAPGVCVGRNAVLGFGAVATSDVKSGMIYSVTSLNSPRER